MARNSSTFIFVHLLRASSPDLCPRPIERQRRLAEREAVEVARDHAFHALDRFTLFAFDRDQKRSFARLERRDRIWKPDHAFAVREVDLESVAPMFAKLLEIFCGVGGGNGGLGGRHAQSLSVFRKSGLARLAKSGEAIVGRGDGRASGGFTILPDLGPNSTSGPLVAASGAG